MAGGEGGSFAEALHQSARASNFDIKSPGGQPIFNY
jgi:hypothetical protein